MQVHHYFAIGLKLFAIGLFAYGLKFTPSLFDVIFHGRIGGLEASLAYLICTLGITWGLAFILWSFPVTIAKKCLGASFDKPVEPISKPSILAIFIIAIGLYVLAYGMVDMVYWGVFLHLAEKNGTIGTSIETHSNIAATLFELALGLLLIFKSRSISSHINKVAD